MSFQQRNSLRTVIAVVLIGMLAFTLTFRFRIGPFAEELIVTHVDNQASDAINLAIAEQIAEGEIDYSRIIQIEKNGEGSVTAVKTNLEEVNRLKSRVLIRVDEKLQQLSMEELSVPAGSVLWPELFSGKGPDVLVRVLAARTTDAEFRSEFASAGINQTLHSIYIDIFVVITVMTWSGTLEVPVKTSVVAAQTVIVGTVPTTYFGLEENNGSKIGD